MKSISRVILLSTVGLLAYGQNNNVFAAADILYPVRHFGFHTHTLYTHDNPAKIPYLSSEAGAGSPRGRKLAVSASGAEEARCSDCAGGKIGFIPSSETILSSVSQSRALSSLPLSNSIFSLPLSRGSWRGYESSKESTSGYDKLATLVIPSLTLPISGRELDKSPISGRELDKRMTSGRETEEFLTSGRKAEALSVSKDEEIIKKNKIRVASVCFITDAGNCSGDKFSSNETPGGGSGNPGQNPEYKTPQEQCLDAGYGRSPCPAGSDPIPCPLDPSYFSCPCDSSFNKTCEKPYYGVGESCGGKYRQCEYDGERACQEENPDFTNHCPSGWQMGNETCSYDPTFGLCCNTCVGYNYTEETIPDGYILDKEPCINCSGEETFRIIPNPCDGFMDCGYLGPEPGAETCLSGTITKYDNCKPCPNLGNLSSCPTGYKCEYEKCSNKYYKVDGCQSGYDWDASSKTCTEHCYYNCSLSSCPANAYCDYEACSGKYCFSSCYGGYYSSNNQCISIFRACDEIGLVYFDNGLCTSVDHAFTAPRTVKNLGIVVYVDGKGGGTIANPEGAFCKDYWGRGVESTGVPQSSDLKTIIKDVKSCANTDIILTKGNSNVYPAAWSLNMSSNENEKWCIPAAGILYNIYLHMDMFKELFYNGMYTSVPQIGMTFSAFASSSEYDKGHVWGVSHYLSYGTPIDKFQSLDKGSESCFLPVMEF